MDVAPRQIPRSSLGLMTTGLVGGWLTGSAFAVMLLTLILAVTQAGRGDIGLDLQMSAGVLVLLAGFVWVGGMVCSVIGWFGIAALHGSARIIAWLGILVLSLAVLLPMSAGALNLGGARAFASLGVLVGVGFYVVQATFWARHGTARGLARLALTGAILAAASGLVALLTIWTGTGGPEPLVIVAVFAGPTGGLMAHLGSGLAIGRERETVRALLTFE
ncbi:MAG: hypothetical protein IT385_28910 [Deltaproteobacteria bacterium]|nr:hypothetical protein [Deltaproteobacteria bacterium]